MLDLRLLAPMDSQRLGRVMVLGSRGMVGSAILRRLATSDGVVDVIPVSRDQVDLMDAVSTYQYIESEKPDWIVVAAAKVGGIYANNAYPRDFLFNNLAIEMNAIEGAYRAGVEKLIFLGSSCIYPKFAEQPIREESLLSGALESTNEAYAISKIAGIKLCESYNRQFDTDYRSLMPTNLYGPGDNYHPENSHVIPGLIRRFSEAKAQSANQVLVWGSGRARREFLHVDDLAEAVLHIMSLGKSELQAIVDPRCSHINVGSGVDVTIAELASLISSLTGFEGNVCFDSSKPDGTPRKLTDVSKMKSLGWKPKYDLDEGLSQTIQEFRGVTDFISYRS